MGTRSTIRFYESYKSEKPLVVLYNQFDGYLSGIGQELVDFLSNIKICNGIGSEQSVGNWANGMGCLAAQYIAKHKTKIGNLYITSDIDYQEYNYHVKYDEYNQIFIITIRSEDESIIFDGTLEELVIVIKTTNV